MDVGVGVGVRQQGGIRTGIIECGCTGKERSVRSLGIAGPQIQHGVSAPFRRPRNVTQTFYAFRTRFN